MVFLEKGRSILRAQCGECSCSLGRTIMDVKGLMSLKIETSEADEMVMSFL